MLFLVLFLCCSNFLQITTNVATNHNILFVNAAFRPPALSEEIGCSPTLTIFRNILLLPTYNHNDDDESNNHNSLIGSSSRSISHNGNTANIVNVNGVGNNNVPSITKRGFWWKQKGQQQQDLYYFDPFQLANDENFARYREAELKHGRVCMIAMLEYITIPLLKHINIPVGLNDNNEMIFMTIIPSTFPESIMNSIFYTATQLDYIKVIISCGIIETFILIQRSSYDIPGDYSIGYFGIRNIGLHTKELLYELEHGRLCMIAFLLACILELSTNGKSWTEQWITFLKYWIQQF